MALATLQRKRKPGRPAVSAEAMPRPHSIAPMLALGSDHLPSDGSLYGFEYKWDGVRAICYWDGRTLTLSSRNRLNMTVQYPELQALGPALGDRRVVLDGEVVALDDVDRPSFPRLQKRMKVTNPAAALRLSRDVPVYFFIFDLLHLEGRSTTGLPFIERRGLLEELTIQGPNWQVSPVHIDQGAAMLETARANMLEGIVAKKLDSIYQPGVRSSDWLKIKLVLRQEFVVGGWTPEKNADGGLGSLQLGYYDERGKLRYAGAVGSGFSHAEIRALLKLLQDRRAEKNPFADSLPRRDVLFAKPSLVAEVEFRRWPEGGMLQQAAYKGLRQDKPAAEVVKELHACMGVKKTRMEEAKKTRMEDGG